MQTRGFGVRLRRRQTQAADEADESSIRADRIEHQVCLDLQQTAGTLHVGLLQPLDRLIPVIETRVEHGQIVRRCLSLVDIVPAADVQLVRPPRPSCP